MTGDDFLSAVSKDLAQSIWQSPGTTWRATLCPSPDHRTGSSNCCLECAKQPVWRHKDDHAPLQGIWPSSSASLHFQQSPSTLCTPSTVRSGQIACPRIFTNTSSLRQTVSSHPPCQPSQQSQPQPSQLLTPPTLSLRNPKARISDRDPYDEPRSFTSLGERCIWRNIHLKNEIR